MSPVSVFVSSTRGDLDEDCRPHVIESLEGYALVVQMDHWPLDSEDDVNSVIDLCHHKVRDESTHFIGLFAFRRGWIPPAWRDSYRSITEAEYDWARQYGKRIAVFLPNPTSDFAKKLRERAREQSKSETEAQNRFLERVREDMFFRDFKHETQLAVRVVQQCELWRRGGGIRGAAAAATQASSLVPQQELLSLGQGKQVRAFESLLDPLSEPSAPQAASVLIHGPVDFGQDHLAERLAALVASKASSPPKQIRVSIGVAWRGSNAESLCSTIGKELGRPDCDNTQELVDVMSKVLQSIDVVLDIRHIQRFEGMHESSLLGFFQDFWKPLAVGINQTRCRQLITLLGLEKAESTTENDSSLIQSIEQFEEQLDGHKIISLPRLGNMRVGELVGFLKRWKSPEDATRIAERLIEETGGAPNTLRGRLREQSIWESS